MISRNALGLLIAAGALGRVEPLPPGEIVPQRARRGASEPDQPSEARIAAAEAKRERKAAKLLARRPKQKDS